MTLSPHSLACVSGIPFVHLSSPMPYHYRSHKSIPRGVSNRRAALSWIKNNNIKDGVLYFGDDDNTFDLRLFSEIRFTKRVSMFPVGLIGDYSVSSPVVKDVSLIAAILSREGRSLIDIHFREKLLASLTHGLQNENGPSTWPVLL